MLQDSFGKLAKAIHGNTRANEAEWLEQVSRSRWLHGLQELLLATIKIVCNVAHPSASK